MSEKMSRGRFAFEGLMMELLAKIPHSTGNRKRLLLQLGWEKGLDD